VAGLNTGAGNERCTDAHLRIKQELLSRRTKGHLEWVGFNHDDSDGSGPWSIYAIPLDMLRDMFSGNQEVLITTRRVETLQA
jgi:hypothetical protein